MPLLAVFLLQRRGRRLGFVRHGVCAWELHGGECFLGEARKILFQRCALGRQMDVCVTVPAAELCCYLL